MICNTCQCTIYELANDAPGFDVWARRWDDRDWCRSCLTSALAEAKVRRKTELDATPRCTACGKHRANWWVGAGRSVNICGRCKSRARRALLGQRSLAFHTFTGAEVMGALTEGGSR